MSTSAGFKFEGILALALGQDTKDLSETEKTIIKDRLDRKIENCRTARFRSSRCTGIATHDSLNHSVVYVELKNDGITRFSIENTATSKEGTASPGKLIIKFQDFRRFLEGNHVPPAIENCYQTTGKVSPKFLSRVFASISTWPTRSLSWICYYGCGVEGKSHKGRASDI